jgi:hypothetical protein
LYSDGGGIIRVLKEYFKKGRCCHMYNDRIANSEDNASRKPNRLINEKSPYLLQHAYNPVEWFPWGAEAFEKAQAENKPVFLSIGYS